jgi:hypothetical protein
MIIIHRPIWNAHTGRRTIGLAVHKILQENEIVEVMIDYKRKDGSLIYPHKFEISKGNCIGYPEVVIKGVRIMEIPIDKFKEVIVR